MSQGSTEHSEGHPARPEDADNRSRPSQDPGGNVSDVDRSARRNKRSSRADLSQTVDEPDPGAWPDPYEDPGEDADPPGDLDSERRRRS